jgi:hypothetical protein
MKQTVGFGMVLAFAVAALRIGGGTSGPEAPEGAGATMRPAVTQSLQPVAEEDYGGGCTAFKAAPATNKYPYDTSAGAAKSVMDRFFDANSNSVLKGPAYQSVHYAIALAPDPVHTNLSLMFDRQMAVIQQAAQDEGYTYDSSWLPWQTGPAYSGLIDRQFADDITADREACPGVLMFRRSVGNKTEHPYAAALVVLVVGEQPTGGLNAQQWANAIVWLNKNASTIELQQNGEQDAISRPRILRVLGPTFSGSLVSLERELKTDVQKSFPSASTPIRVFSGTNASCSSIRWFEDRFKNPRLDQDPAQGVNEGQVLFGSFSENDELRIYRFLSYIDGQGTHASDTAILSEDETAYGGSPQANSSGTGQATGDGCDFPYDVNDRPVRLFYPRDISSLRNAYEKQSVFSGSGIGAGAGSGQSTRAAHPILHEDSAGQTQDSPTASDTIQAYSGDQTAIEQEAVLYGIVSYLRAHHNRYIILRCTNPLDSLFLIRFFHRAYPEGRIVTVGADLLFRREIDTTEFRGVLALSNYALLPRDQHWSSLSLDGGPPPVHAHRVFESNGEGSYIAARYLFGSQNYIHPPQSNGSPSLAWKPDIPEFADPFWMHSASEAIHSAQAPTWLAAVGRDGYWPLAVLNGQSKPDPHLHARSPDKANPPGTPISTMVQAVSAAGVFYQSTDGGTSFSSSLRIELPIPWEVCTACAFLLLAYQIAGLWVGHNLTSSGLFAIFRRVPSRSQAVLLGLNAALAAMILLSLLSVGLIGFTRPDAGHIFGVNRALVVLGVLLAVLAPLVLLWLRRSRGRLAAISFAAALLLFATVLYFAFWFHKIDANEIPLFYRMGHLTSGVSPLLPVLLLLGGFYLWTWQALAGNSLLQSGRPMLPSLAEPAEYRISAAMGRRIVRIANPLCIDFRIIALPIFVVLLALWLFAGDLFLLGLESHAFAAWINLALLFAFAITTAETTRLYFTWVDLKRLLAALGRRRLQRTFARLSAVESSSLWSVSGNVQRIQYSFFIQQLDAARRLLDLPRGGRQSVLKAVVAGTRFAEVCAPRLSAGSRWEDPVRRLKYPVWPVQDNCTYPFDYEMVLVRTELNHAVTDVLENILIPAWNTESTSLSLDDSQGARPKAAAEDNGFDMKLSEDAVIRTAEEFVCFHYLAFIQTILVRMRTMVLSMICLFVSVCLAISFYPFVPRTQIGLWMCADLLLIAVAVIYVYAGMERDKVLSYITNTDPRLSREFYLKTAGFLAGPILGLITAQFPAISESILSWLQPGAIK